jgi:hypothetical protein
MESRKKNEENPKKSGNSEEFEEIREMNNLVTPSRSPHPHPLF